jgi:putative spermidine/putrescine transport system ATP-binding protein
MSFVEIKNLKKYFKNVVAADIDHLSMQEGEFVSLLGPSGCGKTTTLRCIAGSLEPDSGSIFVKGREITHMPIHKRRLGLVFQDYALFPHMAVFDNVAYGLRYQNWTRPEIRKKVIQSLELVGLAGFEGRYPHQLSGGQQQRVAFARSVVYEPDVLLLDEPLSNLDFKLRKTMRFELKRMQRQLKITTLFVTHDQQEALSLSDWVVVMNEGRVEQVGTPNDIYENPVSVFVADFIGSTNIIKGVATSCDSSRRVCTVRLSSSSALPIPFREPVNVGEEVSFIIKPEKIELRKNRQLDTDIQGKISGASYLGSAFNYEVDLGNLRLEVLDGQADYKKRYEIGDPVLIALNPDGVKILRR